jgi:monoamine oxidase
MNDVLTRRGFLQQVGALGGTTAVYRAALGLGLLSPSTAGARPDIASVNRQDAPKVLILGSGISGLTAAYELSRKGYAVQVLEASHRAGGRNLTLRSGDRIDETGYAHVCEFDQEPHLYFNAGPARIPGHHRALLEYCRELGVELAPFINENRDAWVQDDAMFGGKPIRNRQYLADTRGFIAELTAKSLTPEQLAAPMGVDDFEQLREYVRQMGELDQRFKYVGSSRAGLADHDFTSPDRWNAPLDLSELIKSRFMYMMSFGETHDQSAMLMEPVGGMDRIVSGFMSKVGHLVKLHSQVRSIRLEEGGVAVTYQHAGRVHEARADFCLNCIPLHLLAGIEHNFSSDYSASFTAIPRGKLFKIGLQAKERFWEREGIYGGISWTMQEIQQIWYPNHGIHRQKGVILGAYTFDPRAGEKFARLSPPERIQLAIQQGEKIHPGYRNYIEKGVSVAWHQMNHMLGCAAQWDEALFERWFQRLQQPEGHHYLIGDQVSYHPGWQEGAIASAHHAIKSIDQRVRENRIVAA